jgi:hypothetical protein
MMENNCDAVTTTRPKFIKTSEVIIKRKKNLEALKARRKLENINRAKKVFFHCYLNS